MASGRQRAFSSHKGKARKLSLRKERELLLHFLAGSGVLAASSTTAEAAASTHPLLLLLLLLGFLGSLPTNVAACGVLPTMKRNAGLVQQFPATDPLPIYFINRRRNPRRLPWQPPVLRENFFATRHFSCDTLVLGESLLATVFHSSTFSCCFFPPFFYLMSELYMSLSTDPPPPPLPSLFFPCISCSSSLEPCSFAYPHFIKPNHNILLDAMQIGGGRFQPEKKEGRSR